MSAKRPKDMSDEELQDSSQWDADSAEAIAPSGRKARAVVSVAFSGEDIEDVAQAARAAGMKLSQFIRAGALEKARLETEHAIFNIEQTTTEGLWGGVLDEPEPARSA